MLIVLDIDLHCHSTCSDGTLQPADLIQRAAARGVDVLALTDHDTLDGLALARDAAQAVGMHFIPGVEISVTWRAQTIHVVGLDIDPSAPQLVEGLHTVRRDRLERAHRMSEALAAVGIPDVLSGALALANNPGLLSRTHFARHLVQRGVVADISQAFQHYLVPGKPGYVPHDWSALNTAVQWICAAGGRAVLAHPGRYNLSAGALDALLVDFRLAGGAAIEVITGSHAVDDYHRFEHIARHYGLFASRGSDFHGPGEGNSDFGELPHLPPSLQPVWHDWEVAG